ncbi:MAG: protein kinase, partial [archaeon]|nr:protein kinase [archaeon]
MSNIDDYEIICKIGKGAFSTVYKVKSKKDKKIYAIKKVDFKKSTEKEKDNSFNEVNLLKKINSPNVIGFVDSFYDQSNNFLYLVMEYASYGDLDLQIQNRIKTRKYYDEDELLSMMEQIAIGLKDIHSKNILHRDLKAANIFVCDPNNKLLKIGDFNVSKVINPFSLKNTQTGTPYYASPEVWNNMPYDFKSDIWSVGCLFYEMTSLTAPFKGKSMKELYNNIEKGFFNPLPKRYSKNLFNIISICLRQDDKERPTAEELLEYIRKIRNPPKPLEIKKEEPKPKYLPKIVNEGNFDPIINHYKSIKSQSSDPKRLKSASKPKALQPLYTEHNIPTPKNDDKNLKRNQSYLIGSNKRILHTVSPKKTPIDLDIKVNYHYLNNGTFDENKNK